EPDWKSFYKDQSRLKVWLPSYVFDRKPCWAEPSITEKPINETLNFTSFESNNHQPIQIQMNTTQQPNRKVTILEKISEIIMNTSGMELESSEYDQSFLELGLDSLVLTQMALTCKNEFNTAITFRQLNGEFSTPNLLASYLDDTLPADRFAPTATIQQPVNIPMQNNPTIATQPVQVVNSVSYSNNDSAMNLIAQQLQLLGRQLELLQGNQPNPV